MDNLIESITSRFKVISVNKDYEKNYEEYEEYTEYTEYDEYGKSLNDLIYIIELQDIDETIDTNVSFQNSSNITVKTLQNCILVLSSHLEHKLNEDTINLVYSRMSLSPSSIGYKEYSNYQKLIRFYEITKCYLMNLKSNKMIETPFITKTFDDYPELINDFNIFINQLVAESNFDPSNVIYKDFSLYSKNLLNLLNELIKSYGHFIVNNCSSIVHFGTGTYSDRLRNFNILEYSFIKRLKIIIMIYNITIILAYFVVKY